MFRHRHVEASISGVMVSLRLRTKCSAHCSSGEVWGDISGMTAFFHTDRPIVSYLSYLEAHIWSKVVLCAFLCCLSTKDRHLKDIGDGRPLHKMSSKFFPQFL
jgi:hypothetical protein